MDKVQKIREEVERLMYGFNLEADIASCEDAETEELANIKYQLCKKILDYIDKVQEEPVSDKMEKVVEEIVDPTVLNAYGVKEIVNRLRRTMIEPVSEDLGEYINELSKQFPEVSFAKLSRIAVRVAKWQQNQDVKNKLPKVTDRTELDEYAYQCAYNMSNDWAIDNPTWHDVEDACKLGAKWQKEQDQSTIELAEDHAMLAGMDMMKEEMMKKAKSGTVQKDNQVILDDGTYMDLDPSMQLKPSFVGLKEGDRIKVILIKED